MGWFDDLIDKGKESLNKTLEKAEKEAKEAAAKLLGDVVDNGPAWAQPIVVGLVETVGQALDIGNLTAAQLKKEYDYWQTQVVKWQDYVNKSPSNTTYKSNLNAAIENRNRYYTAWQKMLTSVETTTTRVQSAELDKSMMADLTAWSLQQAGATAQQVAPIQQHSTVGPSLNKQSMMDLAVAGIGLYMLMGNKRGRK